jgi:lipid-A-disaccharide synthase
MVIQTKYISLVNLIMNKKIVKELIQNELNTLNLTNELIKITTENSRNQLLNNYEELQQKLGKQGASKRVAELMVNYLKA